MRIPLRITVAAVLLSVVAGATAQRFDVVMRLATPPQPKESAVPAVVWLKPINGTPALPFASKRTYTLLQKNRTFTPHLLVIPVGSTVDFPNADPFFHNVFSLFDGKRFDLGLYEAGSHKQVVFSREGVSYIFCNIHPEMSAVVLALTTPLYAATRTDESAVIHGVPQGEYDLSVWVEGVPQSALNVLTRTVRVSGDLDLGTISVPVPPVKGHVDKFGKAYDSHSNSTY